MLVCNSVCMITILHTGSSHIYTWSRYTVYSCNMRMTDYCRILDETFTFSNNFIYEEKTALRYTDVFINCSVSPTDAYTSWDFENTRITDIIGSKYSKNISGLTIHNVTEEDQGHYICFLGTANPPNATILLSVGCKLMD